MNWGIRWWWHKTVHSLKVLDIISLDDVGLAEGIVAIRIDVTITIGVSVEALIVLICASVDS